MTSRDFLIWLAVPIPFLLLSSSIFIQRSQWSPYDVMMFALDSSAGIFSFGIPLFLGAGLVFTSAGSRRALSSARMVNQLEPLLVRVLFLAIVHSAYQMMLLIVSFIGASQQPLTANLNPEYLGGFFAASFLFSLVLSPVASLVALWMDDWRLTTITGLAVCSTLLLVGGQPNFPVAFSEVALMTPIHLYRAIGVSLGRVEFASPSAMVNYVGFFFAAENLVVPLILYVGLAASSILIGRKILLHNIARWHREKSWIEETDEPAEDAVHSEVAPAPKGLLSDIGQRRKVLAAILVSLILVAPIASFTYTASQRDQSEVVIYETPATGVPLSLGDWLYGTFNVSEPPPGVSRMISFRLSILDWGSAPDEMQYVRGCQHITLDEFEMMNDTEREDAGFSGGSTITRDRTEFSGEWWGLSGIWGTQVWAIRFLDSNWNVTAGSLAIKLSVVLGDFR